MPIFCSVEGCHNKTKVKGMCINHYNRLLKYGTLDGYKPCPRQHLQNTFKREYISFCNMKTRCRNKKHPQYKDYGGRGIKICERWLERFTGFKNFLDDMGERPDGCSLDRIDVNGDYCPENCRWASRKEQQNNMRRNVHITYNGETHSYEEWGKIFGMPASSIAYRVKKYPLEIAFKRPYHSK